MKLFILNILIFFFLAAYTQTGKNGPLTVSSLGNVVNHYAPVTSSIVLGSNTLAIAPVPSFSLCTGDLIMIYQAQGAAINTSNTAIYGDITNFNSAGFYEFKYVQNVNGNVVTVQSVFANSYNVALGRTQVIKVPQYTTLTINSNASIMAKAWKDTVISTVPYRFGGLVVIHASNIINNGTITASSGGFRGGPTTGNQPYTTGITAYVSSLTINGGIKGESIAGSFSDYDLLGGRFCRGAPANGGGGGTSTNSSGGGGANGFNLNVWTGQGVMVVDMNNPFSAWSLDPGFIANGNALTNSSGGGRGGYSWAAANMNATVNPPGATVWQGDNRREVGGLGGRPLTNINANGRIYLGGGGGAGDANNSGGTPGGNGGGIVYLIASAAISGSGVIESNGASVPLSTCICNGDGQGGGGGGGSIVIKTGSIANTQTINCYGGQGGNQSAIVGIESEGGGGGGGGGFAAISTGFIIPNINGGLNGISLSSGVTEMTSNGGTKGASGQTGTVSPSFITFIPPQIFSNSPICAGNTLSLSTSSVGVTSYTWSGPNNFTSTIQSPVITNATSLSTGIYTLTISTMSNCTVSNTAALTVYAAPSLTVISDNPTVCVGTTAILSAAGAIQYTWQPMNINNFSVNVAPMSSTTFTVIGSDSNGCKDTAMFFQTAFSLPVVSITSNDPVSCSGSTVMLNGNGAQSYTWLPGAASTESINISPLQNATYTIFGIDNNGCTGSSTYTQFVHPTPTVSVSSNTFLVCPNDFFTITANGAFTYSWQPSGINGNSFVTSTGQPTTYTVIGMSVDNCTAMATASVTIKPAPTLSFQTNTITCASLGSATVYASGGTGPFSFSWSPVVQTGSVASGMFPGIHTITVHDNGTGCIFTLTANFDPLVPLTGTVSATNSLSCYNVNTGTAAIVLSGGSGSEYYSWTSSAGTQTQSSATMLPAGISTISVTDALTFCNVTQTFFITQPSSITVNISSASPTICVGKDLGLFVTIAGGIPAYNYTWTSGASTSTIIVNRPIAGNNFYAVTGNDGNNCSFSDSISISFVPNPTLSVSDVSICPMQNAVLIASGADTYTWNSGFVGNVFVSSPPNTTQYTVTGSAMGCTGTAVANVSVAASPTVLVSATNPVCKGDTLKLFSNINSGYMWTGPANFSSTAQNPFVLNVSTANNGLYNIKVTAANGCTTTAAIVVTVNPLPHLSASGSTVCQGQAVHLWAGYINNTSYLWSGPNSFSSTLQNILIPDAKILHAGEYSVTITDNLTGCSNSGTTHVLVVTQPTPVITSNNPVCSGGILTLNGNGGGDYQWRGPGNFSSNQQNISIGNITSGGLFTLSVLQGPCRIDTSVMVVVHALPLVTITGTNEVCEGTTLQLYAGSVPSAVSYSWSGPAPPGNQTSYLVGQFFSVNTGIYSVSITDVNGCINSDTILVKMLSAPLISATGATVCIGENALLTATGGSNYSWTGPAGYSSSSQNAVVQNISISQAGSYTAVVTGSNSCKASSVVQIVANPYPLPVPLANIQPDMACMNGEIRLVGSGGDFYLWSGPGGFVVPGQNVTVNITDYAMAGIYTLTVKNENNCVRSTTVMVHIYPQPQMNISVNNNYQCVPFCSDVQLIPLKNIAPVVSHSLLIDYSFIGDSLTRYCFDKAGIYTLSISYTDTNNCVNSSTLAITAHPKPTANFNYHPENPTVDIDRVQFYNTSDPGRAEFIWFFPGNTDSVKIKQPSFVFEHPGNQPITLIVTNQFGCSDTITKAIMVNDEFGLYVPNAFTPNQDGLNDVFQPKGHGIEKYQLSIFDRWGEQVFISEDFLRGWDGTFKGKECKSDIYVWKIILRNSKGLSKSFTGHVSLIRGARSQD